MNREIGIGLQPVQRFRIAGAVGIIICLIAANAAVAQDQIADDELQSEFGLFIQGGLNLHAARFVRLPGVPNCCKEFTGGSGTGIIAGLLFDLPVTSSLFLDIRAAYAMPGAGLREQESTTIIAEGEPMEATFEHQLDASLGGLLFEPSLGYRLGRAVQVRVGPGLVYLFQGSFEQREVLLEPQDFGLFENNRRVRNEFSGNIPDFVPFQPFIHAGVGFDLPLNSSGTLVASPEMDVSFGLGDLVADSSWSVNMVRIGVALRRRPSGTVPDRVIADIPRPITIDTSSTDVQNPVSDRLLPAVSAVAIDENGMERDVVTLNVEEFVSTNMRPLLNYLFFAPGDATIPERYSALSSSETTDFVVERLHGVPTLPTYHHLLNIVGRRMTEHPDATLRLVGCNDGEGEAAADGQRLSRARAESVATYLKSVWKIDPSRLTVEARGLPETPSNRDLDDGDQENRRVELYSNLPEILAPVITDDTLRVTNPPAITFRPSVTGSRSVDLWKITVSQGSNILREFEGKGALPREVEWDLANEQNTVPRLGEPLEYRLNVVDNRGDVGTSPSDSLPVNQTTISQKRRERIADRYIDRYSLILFEFDKATLTEANSNIADFIRKRIGEGAEVSVTGHTDRIGPDEYNLDLSRRRADMTAKAIEAPGADVTGKGESVEVEENDLPEGRFYSRTVRIVVETPVSE